jgi:cytochrome c biogenesis protein
MLKRINKGFWGLIKQLGDLRFAIILLLCIATFSSLGTVIEQNKELSFYEINYPINNPIFGVVSSSLILFLGLDHVYQTWWFIFIILLFGSSLIACTLSRQLPSLKLAQLWQFYKTKGNLQKFELNFCLNGTSLSRLSYELSKNNYHIIQKGPFLYAYKGLIGKVGPIIVHISIIITLCGAVLGSVSGFMVQELIPLGGLFHLQNVITSGPFSYIDQDLEGYVRDFRITYSDEGNIDQFYSDLLLLNNKGEKLTDKTIYVNEPLRYKSLTFYQTDWSIVGLTLQIDNSKLVQLPLKLITTKTSARFWISALKLASLLETDSSNDIFIMLEDLTGKFQIYNSKQIIISEQDLGSSFFINGHKVKILDVTTSTGLQVKSDPGIIFVYVGFLFLIFSVLLSYTSYSQIWAIKKEKNLYLSGRTNRAIYFFEQDFISIITNLTNSR